MRALIFTLCWFASCAMGQSGKDTARAKDSADLDAVNVEGRGNTHKINGRGLQKTETLTEGEFKKAACCTLSESFETTNTIELSNSDGVSGIRQIEMLGLAGKYVLMSRDNINLVRGIASLNGLGQVPGPLVGAVHIAKGAGSVTNGFEGISGGVNYAIKNGLNQPKLFLNLYSNSQSRNEINILSMQRHRKQGSNTAYFHLGNQSMVLDQNKDGFGDMPLVRRYVLGDQFNFYGDRFEGQLGFNAVKENKYAGQISGFAFTGPGEHKSGAYSFTQDDERYEGFAKVGILLDSTGEHSIGNIFSFSQGTTKLQFGNAGKTLDMSARSMSFTSMYGSPDDELWSTRSGVNFQFDQVSDKFRVDSNVKYDFNRTEYSAGAFSEIVYKAKKFSAVLGLRGDLNNLYGFYFTPRLHLKYDVNPLNKIHIQAGRGRRTAWIFAENYPLLISNRQVHILGQNNKTAYGLEQEDAWNGGVSFLHNTMLFKFPATFSADAFYTYFNNQVIIDRDASPTDMFIANVTGSNSAVMQLDMLVKPHRRIDLHASYRYVKTMMPLGGKMRLQPMQSPHRALFTANFQNRSKWFLDLIAQVNSPKRLPSTENNPESLKLPEFSPWYAVINLQLRKNIGNWEIYAGGENLGNVYNRNPILAANDPSSPYFDAAYSWGPSNGVNFYAGFRLSLK